MMQHKKTLHDHLLCCSPSQKLRKYGEDWIPQSQKKQLPQEVPWLVTKQFFLVSTCHVWCKWLQNFNSTANPNHVTNIWLLIVLISDRAVTTWYYWFLTLLPECFGNMICYYICFTYPWIYFVHWRKSHIQNNWFFASIKDVHCIF